MRIEEVPLLLSALQTYQYVEASEVTAQMWAESLEKDMPVEFACTFVADYWGRADVTTKLIVPGLINTSWRQHKAYERDRLAALHYSESACNWKGCTCTHDNGCYKGWIDTPDATSTMACPNCKPSLSRVLSEIPGPGHRTDADQSRIRTRFQEVKDH
jgi:hypothetical protein